MSEELSEERIHEALEIARTVQHQAVVVEAYYSDKVISMEEAKASSQDWRWGRAFTTIIAALERVRESP